MEQNELERFGELVQPNRQHRVVNRLNIQTKLIREQHGMTPTVVDVSASKLVMGEEQTYTRHRKIKDIWTPLDYGWIEPDQIGWVVVDNREGRGLVQGLSPQEREELEANILEVRLYPDTTNQNLILIPPGCALPILASDPRLIEMRARDGRMVAVELTVFPK